MKLGLVGVGAIAVKQHLPAIAGSATVTLCAAASQQGTVDGVPNYRSLGAMLEGSPEVEAVSLCVPPAVRTELAREAIAAGRHVFLEKPPGTSIAEVQLLAAEAAARGVTLFASWHSRYAPAVETFRTRLAETALRSVRVTWKEDVRFWHPGQHWIWEPGGFGVFDPGINAFSIMTHALPRPFRLTRSVLYVPENCAQPIRADLAFVDSADAPITCDFDFDQPDDPTWDILAETDAGAFRLAKGGSELFLDGASLVDTPEAEYKLLYERFVALVAAGESDVDIAPLTHVADAFMAARFETVGPFDESVPAARR